MLRPLSQPAKAQKNPQYKREMLNEWLNSNLRTHFQDHPHYFTNCRSFIRANIKDNVFHKGAEIIIHLLVPENQSVGESVCERVIAGVFNIENIHVNVQIISALQPAMGETISSDSLKCPFECFSSRFFSCPVVL